MEKIEIRLEAVIFNTNNEILLALHSKKKDSYWVLPGGHLKFGEKLENGLIRELKEELNFNNITIKELLYIDEFIDSNNKRHVVKAGFLTEVPGIDEEKPEFTDVEESIKSVDFFSSLSIKNSREKFYPSKNFFINLLENRNG